MEKKKRNYQKPEVFVINAEPEMLLAGSEISTGDTTNFSEDGYEGGDTSSWGGSWTTSSE